MKKSSSSSTYNEFFAPVFMFILLSAVFALYEGVTSYHGIISRGVESRIGTLIGILFIFCLYLPPWYKLRYKTHRILLLMLAFMAIMFWGCHFVPWWNIWMSIPLTILWYPCHRRVLKELPCKNQHDDDNKQGVVHEKTNDTRHCD